MTRKSIPPETQRTVLMQSRRRCCLCFWLEGIDEVSKGQVAHLDQDSSNSEFDNLAFLCLEHHDEYDSTPSQSKGLQPQEVKKYRDMLYQEMEYRFKTVQSRKLDLEILQFIWVESDDRFKVLFRLKNSGESEVRNVAVSICLPEGTEGRAAELPDLDYFGLPRVQISIPGFKPMPRPLGPFEMMERREDFFENDGRVGIVSPLGGMRPVLLPDHTTEFEGLTLTLKKYPVGSEVKLEYRIDAEQMTPIRGAVKKKVPDDIETHDS